MQIDEGKPPDQRPFVLDEQKMLNDRLAELRKSSETIGGWCLASIIAASLRISATPNRIAVTFGVIGLVLGMMGSSLRSTSEPVDPAQLTAYLRRTYGRRHRARTLTVLALLAGLSSILYGVWSSK